MSGKNTTTRTARINGLQVQTSLYGKPYTMGWGRSRVSLNLLDYDDFTAVEQREVSSAGGKGGGSKNTTISYNYFATIIMAIGYGEVQGVHSVYRGKSVFSGSTALSQAGLNLFTGAPGQAPWAYMVGAHPDKALGYSGIAYVAASNYALDGNGGLENHTLEVDWGIQETAVSTGDANPADILQDFLENSLHGIPNWPSGFLADLTQYRTYCRAQNIFLSPLIDQQTQASQFIADLLIASNSDMVLSGGNLKIVPYGDTAITANGYTYTPAVVPVYDLTDDDFIPPSDRESPLTIEVGDPAKAYNIVQVEHRDRAHQYDISITTAQNGPDIATNGKKQNQSPTSLSAICDPQVANVVAHLILNRGLFIRDKYNFSLPWSFSRLEPMDVVTVTDAGLGLDRFPVRIESFDENDAGYFDVVAEPLLIGTAQTPLYPSQSASGYLANYDAPPGDVSPPVIFNPPSALTNGNLEVWAAVAGVNPNWGGAQVYISLDGSNYVFSGTISGGARYGVLTADFLDGSDPDTTHTLSVDLSASRGVLNSATAAEADAGTSLCWVGGEIIAYSDATLTAPNQYSLGGYIRRAQNGTQSTEHNAGSAFVRLDSLVFKYPYLPQQVGETLSVKFASFNIYGRAEQSLADVTAYTVTLTAVSSIPNPVENLGLQGEFNSPTMRVIWQPSERAIGYPVTIYKADGTTSLRTFLSYSPGFSYSKQDAWGDGYLKRTFVIEVIAQNLAGDSEPSTVTVTNAPPAKVTSVSITGTGGNRTVAWATSTEPDFSGYIAYYSNTSGFNPAAGDGSLFYRGVINEGNLSSLTTGLTYYVRVAAFDSWSDDPSELIFSDQVSFVA